MQETGKSNVSLCFRVLSVLLLSSIVIIGSSCSAKATSSAIIGEKLISSDVVAGDKFGAAVSISGDTAVVGARDKNSSMGAAYVFVRSGTTWSQQAELTASDGAAGDAFGISVSISGDTVVVGAYTRNSSAGAAYVFVRSGNTWSQQAELSPSDLGSAAEFGASVCISGDTVVVGSAGKSSFTGAAYVYQRSGNTWSQQDELSASDGIQGDFFGYPVSVDADTIAVGSPGKNNDAGVVYMFTRSGTGWGLQAELNASDAHSGDSFGSAVAVSGDKLFIGAPAQNSSTGAVYVFIRSGSAWVQQNEFDTSDSAVGDEFGCSVCVSGDMAVVGACNKGSAKGYIYVFAESGTSWITQTEFTASGTVSGDAFGISLAVSGSAVIVGEQTTNKGGAFIYADLLQPGPGTGTVTTAG